MAESIASRRQFNLMELDNSNSEKMQKIPINERSWDSVYYGRYNTSQVTTYNEKQVKDIIKDSNIPEKRKMSRTFFSRGGFYKQVIMYYSSLLKYAGILIPHPTGENTLKTAHIKKRYDRALDFIDHLTLPVLFQRVTQKVLVDGAYFGIIQSRDKNSVGILDLPGNYCVTRFKDINGNNLIEFDVSYFSTIANDKNREAALNAYPDFISNYYKIWSEKKSLIDKWCLIPSDIGICFLFSDGEPPFLNVIPATLQYDETLEIERERDLEEIRKIIIQKIPHNATTDNLVFEPDEALEMHKGTVDMMKENKNVSVLTTYADVDAIVSKTSAESASNSIEKMLQNIFNKAGVSSQLFSSTGSTTLKLSIKKDISLMMILANQYSLFITTLVNRFFGNSNINFKYMILPVGEQNWDDYMKTTKELASLGYSWLAPAVAQGFSQRDLLDIKKLENESLDLIKQLIPLQSSFTQSAADSSENGAPKKENENKADQTIKNEKSLDNTMGE